MVIGWMTDTNLSQIGPRRLAEILRHDVNRLNRGVVEFRGDYGVKDLERYF